MNTTDKATRSERYVWMVTRHLPAATGPDVAAELRQAIEETVEAKTRAGVDPAEAEETTLTGLGDPDALARKYDGRPGFLIGPGLYPEYVRLLRLLAWVILPTYLIASLLVRGMLTGDGWAQALVDSFVLLPTIGVHLAFWTTLAFAIIDWSRPEASRDEPRTPWSTDQMPTEGPRSRTRALDVGVSVLFIAAFIAVVVWQLTGVGDQGPGIQVLNPDLWLGWEVLIVAPLVVALALHVLVWRAGRWSATLAAVTVLTDASAAAVGLWLVHRDQLLVPDLPRRLAEALGGSADWTVSTPVVALIVVLFPLWDSIATVRKARRAPPQSR